MTHSSVEFNLTATYQDPRFSTAERVTAGKRGTASGACCMLGPVEMRNSVKMLIGLCTGEILHFGSSTRDPAGTMEAHEGAVRCMAYAASRQVLFSGGEDRVIRMWDLSHGPPTAIAQSLYGHGGCVLYMCWHDTIGLVSSSTDGCLSLWGERESQNAQFLRFPTYVVKQQLAKVPRRGLKELWFTSICVQGAADKESCRILATGSDGYLHLYKLNQAGQIFVEVKKVKVHSMSAGHLLCVEGYAYVTSAEKVKMYDTSALQPSFEETGEKVLTALAWRPKENLFTGDEDGGVAMYDIIRGVQFAEIASEDGPIVGIGARRLPQGDILYTASGDNTLCMWDLDNYQCIKTLTEKESEITCMVMLPRLGLMVTGHENGAVRLWTVDKPTTITAPSGGPFHGNTVSCLVCLPLTSSSEVAVAFGSYDCSISFCSFKQNEGGTRVEGKFEKVIEHAHAHNDEILVLACSVNYPTVLFSGGNEGIIHKWCTRTKSVLAAFTGHTDAISALEVRKYIVSGSCDGTVRIWTEKGDTAWTLSGQGTVRAIMIGPNEAFATAGQAKIRFWNIHDNQLVEAQDKMCTMSGDVEINSLFSIDEALPGNMPSPSNGLFFVGTDKGDGRVGVFSLPEEWQIKKTYVGGLDEECDDGGHD
eukprot:GEMP01028392.1.p1 GENE.GEMP01028392.1~~GEMP01028392.1.p1  ORF type:complete len:647 (+),score=152.71 GEMP01028392.1:22-1962(+)